jgi:hypothetical protein
VAVRLGARRADSQAKEADQVDFLKDFVDILLWTLWIAIFVSFIFLVIRIIVDIFRDKSLGGIAKILWLLFVVYIPVLGSIIYLFARGQGMAQRDNQEAKALRAAQVEYTRGLVGEAAGPAGQILAAKELLEAGTITEAEFDKLKKKALS